MFLNKLFAVTIHTCGTAVNKCGHTIKSGSYSASYSLNVPNPSGNPLTTALNIVIGVVAALSLLFVVIGGFRYVLSDGNPQAASTAKSTIIYAIVGLVVALSAELIVSFVIGNGTLGG